MKVQVTHYRKIPVLGVPIPSYDIKKEGLTKFMDPRGGITRVRLYDPKTKDILAEGVAHCSDRDNYSKKLGRLIATGRAMKQLEDTKC